MLLRQRSPTISAKSRAERQRSGPTIVEPCFIDETAEVDSNAKIGPNVSIGAGVKIGYGCRVKEALVLDGAVLEVHFRPYIAKELILMKACRDRKTRVPCMPSSRKDASSALGHESREPQLAQMTSYPLLSSRRK